MKEEFVTFHKFTLEEDAIEFGNALAQEKIDFLAEEDALSFDPTFSFTQTNNKWYLIRLRRQDFPRARALEERLALEQIRHLPPEYHLFSFSTDELKEVLASPDEWSRTDVVLARQLLKKSGTEIPPEEVKELEKNRSAQLSKPAEAKISWLVIGYTLAVLGVPAMMLLMGNYITAVLQGIPVMIGVHLARFRKILPDGTRVYAYSQNSRKHGLYISIAGIVSLILSFVVLWINV